MTSKPPFHYHLVLLEPLIPPNTGNAGRLSVATQSTLHLIEPLGFSIDDKAVRRAGLDYWKFVDLHVHANFEAFLTWLEQNDPGCPFYLIEDSPRSEQLVYDVTFPPKAAFIFGKETTGIPAEIQTKYQDKLLKLPMFSKHIRSLNLANTIAIVLYEAIRQNLKS